MEKAEALGFETEIFRWKEVNRMRAAVLHLVARDKVFERDE